MTRYIIPRSTRSITQSLFLLGVFLLGTSVFGTMPLAQAFTPKDISTPYGDRTPKPDRNNSSEAFEARFNEGVQAYRSGRYDNAYKIFSTLHRQQPETVKATYYLAMTEAQLGNFAQARTRYQEVLTLDPNGAIAALAREGLRYLPSESTLDRPPRFTQASPPSGTPTHATEEPSTSPQRNSVKANTLPPMEAIDDAEADVLPNPPPSSNAFTPDDSASSQASENASDNTLSARDSIKPSDLANTNTTPSTPNTGMSPQDLMMWQMMMSQGNGMNNSGGGNGMNMLPLLMMQQSGNGATPGSGVDPSIMSTMLMNQMMQNFSMGGDKNQE